MPILRADAEGCKWIIDVATNTDCREYGVTYDDLANTMQLMWGHFTQTLAHDIRPTTSRGLTRSLMWIGFGQHVSGVLTRPSYVHQADVLRFLTGVLHDKSSFDHGIEIPWLPEGRSVKLTPQHWIEKRDASYKARRQFWKLR